MGCSVAGKRGKQKHSLGLCRKQLGYRLERLLAQSAAWLYCCRSKSKAEAPAGSVSRVRRCATRGNNET